MAIAAVLEGKEEYVIIDGNLDPDPGGALARVAPEHGVELLAVSVMPGPQMAASIPLCREFRRLHPSIPIVWGGYFPSLYTDAALNARYVDYAIRGQGEETILELLAALRAKTSLRAIKGLSWKDEFGLHVHNPERPLRSPDDYPWVPYHRLKSIEKYLKPTFLGSRTAVHNASLGCPFRCRFCGVVPVFEGREKTEAPERTAAVLGHLKETYGANAVQFYDNNFFLSESRAYEQAERFVPLGMRWWAEGRIDTVLRYSDETWRAIRRSGAAMIFFGAESGSNEALAEMNKGITTEQTLELAARIRRFDIIPEFSFVMGNPQDPDRETHETIRFIRRLKRLNPDAEIIVQHYIPTPHPDGMYGNVEAQLKFPTTPEEWASQRWFNYTVRKDPLLPWLPSKVKRRIDNFELVINSRWPTIQDIHLPQWGRAMLRLLSSWRYALGMYNFPVELVWAQKMAALRKPRLESL
jgi:radical SAM superfamily enzyme YgiQ (UPF0313 family)